MVLKCDGKVYVDVIGEVIIDNVIVVLVDVQKKIDKFDFFDNVLIDIGGVLVDIVDFFMKFGLVMLVVIVIVYFVFVIIFGGVLVLFVILFLLLFIVIGVLVGFYVLGEMISLNVMIGMFMLIGIVVMNVIVLIDCVIYKEVEGLFIREVFLEVGFI